MLDWRLDSCSKRPLIRPAHLLMSKENTAALKDLVLLGKEHLPASEGFLILANQLSYYDLLRLEAILGGRKIVFLADDGAGLHPLLKTHLDREGVDTLVIGEGTDAGSYRSALQDIVTDGSVVIYVPAEAAAVNAPLSTIPGLKLDFLL